MKRDSRFTWSKNIQSYHNELQYVMIHELDEVQASGGLAERP